MANFVEELLSANNYRELVGMCKDAGIRAIGRAKVLAYRLAQHAFRKAETPAVVDPVPGEKAVESMPTTPAGAIVALRIRRKLQQKDAPVLKQLVRGDSSETDWDLCQLEGEPLVGFEGFRKLEKLLDQNKKFYRPRNTHFTGGFCEAEFRVRPSGSS